MKSTYTVEVKSLETEETKENEIHFFCTISCMNIETAIYGIRLRKMLDDRNISFKPVLGYVMDVYPEKNYAIIGHEGSDCGNIKAVRQFDVSWERDKIFQGA